MQEKPDPTISKDKEKKKPTLAKIQRSGTRGLKRESMARRAFEFSLLTVYIVYVKVFHNLYRVSKGV